MKKIKVCHITTVHSSLDTRIFYKECKTLARAGYEVFLIAQHDKEELVDGVRIIGLPRPKNRIVRILGINYKAFWLALREKANVYHFHDPELLLVGALLKLFTHAKVIYDVHEDVPQQILSKHWIPTLLRKPLSIIFNFFEKFFARIVDGVVVATEGIAEKFNRFNPVVIHNYPDLHMLPDSSSTEHNENKKVIIYIGGISRIRGAVEMIRALEYIDNVEDLKLLLIGKFESQELENELKKMPSYSRVSFLGWLQPLEVYKYLKKASVGLVCLHPEPRYILALPVKLFEYMAVGLPVIASNFPLWREIVEGNNCGICVNPLDPKEIADAIKYILEHPDEARKMGENGRKAVLEKYNWEKEGEKLVELYKELLTINIKSI